MKRVMQTKFTAEDGNCFGACIASILELDFIPDIDTASGKENWFKEYGKFLREYKYGMIDVEDKDYNSVSSFGKMFCIVTGKSPTSNCNHSIVGYYISEGDVSNLYIQHDPMPNGTGIIGDPISIVFLIPIN